MLVVKALLIAGTCVLWFGALFSKMRKVTLGDCWYSSGSKGLIMWIASSIILTGSFLWKFDSVHLLNGKLLMALTFCTNLTSFFLLYVRLAKKFDLDILGARFQRRHQMTPFSISFGLPIVLSCGCLKRILLESTKFCAIFVPLFMLTYALFGEGLQIILSKIAATLFL